MIKILVLKCIIILFIVLRVGNGGDLIQFVQDYFNLGFIDATQKINNDFHLGIKSGRLSKEALKHIEERKKQNQKLKEKHNKEMLYLCKVIINYEKINKRLKSQLTPYNWEEIEQTRSLITNHLEMLNEKFDELNIKMYWQNIMLWYNIYDKVIKFHKKDDKS